MDDEKKKTYSVAIPITGVIYDEIEADSEEEAIEIALGKDYAIKDIDEWETHRHIVRGNVCYADHHEATAEEL